VVARFLSRPLLTVLVWQGGATLVVALALGAFFGSPAAFSAILGGLVNIAGCAAYAIALRIGKPVTAGGTLVTMFRAEAGKIFVIVLALWIVLTTYKDVVLPAFFTTFVITVLLFPMALLSRD
jgi:F0F1-type ATP synthase assembly protein I